jgi:hypothetical protein
MERHEILRLIANFISGHDVSLRSANEIETWIDDEFPDDDYMQETVEMLACYRPGGGDWILGESAIQNRLRQVLVCIESGQKDQAERGGE